MITLAYKFLSLLTLAKTIASGNPRRIARTLIRRGAIKAVVKAIE